MSEIDKTIEELEQEVLADLNEAEMKKDSSAAGKGAVKAEPMKKWMQKKMRMLKI